MDFIDEFINFISNLIATSPDIFTHLFEFLNGIVECIGDLFKTGEILLGVFILIILIKIVGHIKEVF